MKHQIKNKKQGIRIKITGVNSKQDELLENFQACKEGSCDCPSDEYVKLEDMNIVSSKEKIVMDLKAKKGKAFDTKEVEKCVNYVINKVSKKL